MYLIYLSVSQTPCVSARHSDVYLRHFGRLGDALVSARRLRVYRRRPAAYPRHIGCMADAMYRRHHLVYPDTPGCLLYIAKCIPYSLASPIRCGCLGDAPASLQTRGMVCDTPVSTRHPRVYGIRRCIQTPEGVSDTPWRLQYALVCPQTGGRLRLRTGLAHVGIIWCCSGEAHACTGVMSEQRGCEYSL